VLIVYDYVVHIGTTFWFGKYSLYPHELAMLGIFPVTKNTSLLNFNLEILYLKLFKNRARLNGLKFIILFRILPVRKVMFLGQVIHFI